jgi:hypothetical protein
MRRTPPLVIARSFASTTGTPSLERATRPSSTHPFCLNWFWKSRWRMRQSVLGSVAGIALDGTGATDITDDGTGGASFTMDNIHLNCEVLGLASSVLDEITARRMPDGMRPSSGLRPAFAVLPRPNLFWPHPPLLPWVGQWWVWLFEAMPFGWPFWFCPVCFFSQILSVGITFSPRWVLRFHGRPASSAAPCACARPRARIRR